jgi:hypothetical protein
MDVESCTIFVGMLDVSRSFVTLDGVPGLYRLKYDSATAPVVDIILVLL